VDNQVQNPPNNPNIVKEKEKEKPKESTKKDDQLIVDNQEKSFVPPHFLNVFNQLGRKFTVRKF